MTFLHTCLRSSLSVLVLWCVTASLSAETVLKRGTSKDVGPSHVSCDVHPKGSEGWKACLGAARVALSDEELFYAGYWLAKTGQYAQALSYLTLTRHKDERILTYTGFATRKLGDVQTALPLYAEALALNPNYVVARAYLGEAYLTQGKPHLAQDQLQEIAIRCGLACPAYHDLEQHIADYLTAHG